MFTVIIEYWDHLTPHEKYKMPLLITLVSNEYWYQLTPHKKYIMPLIINLVSIEYWGHLTPYERYIILSKHSFEYYYLLSIEPLLITWVSIEYWDHLTPHERYIIWSKHCFEYYYVLSIEGTRYTGECYLMDLNIERTNILLIIWPKDTLKKIPELVLSIETTWNNLIKTQFWILLFT